jgi:DNA-binding NarL/FixJ family response regulator
MTSLKPICAVVMKSDVLLKRAAVTLLMLANELEIVVSDATDIQALAMDVDRLKADVVMLNDSLPLAAQEPLTQLLGTRPELKVVIVGSDDNRLQILGREDILLTSVDDLLTVIRSD